MSEVRVSARPEGGHWLVFEYDREAERQVVVGCHCGFAADLENDCGWGDSVVDHIWSAASAEAWDEGYDASARDAYDGEFDPAPNPYRAASRPDPQDGDR